MKWTSGNVLLVISLFAASHPCFSKQTYAKPATLQPMNLDVPSQSSRFSRATPSGVFLSVGGGEQFYKVSGGNRLDTGAGWPLDHYVSDSMSNQPYFYFAAGYLFAQLNDWLPYYSFGVKYMYSVGSTMAGYIDQYSLPDFNNYNFQYDVQIATVLATFKADIYRWKNLMPYLTLGLGVSNATAKNYKEQALNGVTPRVNPAFGTNTVRNFSSSVGVGIDYAMLNNVWLNFEVNYNDFGKVKTGNGVNYTTGTGTNYSSESLNNTLYSTSAMLGVTYYPG